MRGSSLVEVLVAMSLLATALATLAQVFLVAVRANVEARDATYATVLAAQKLEQLRAAPFPEGAPSESIDYLDGSGRALVHDAPDGHAAYTRRTTIEPLPANPGGAVVIAVTVARGEAGNRGVVRLITIRTRKAS